MSRAEHTGRDRPGIDDGLDDAEVERANELATRFVEEGVDSEAFRELAALYSEQSRFSIHSEGDNATTVTDMLLAIGERAYPSGKSTDESDSALSGGRKLGLTNGRADTDERIPPRVYVREKHGRTRQKADMPSNDREWFCRACSSRVTLTDDIDAGHRRWCPHRERQGGQRPAEKGDDYAHRCPECGDENGHHISAEQSPIAGPCKHYGEGYVCYWCSTAFGEGWDGLRSYADHYPDCVGRELFASVTALAKFAYTAHFEAFVRYLYENSRSTIDCPGCETIAVKVACVAGNQQFCTRKCLDRSRRTAVTIACTNCGKREKRQKSDLADTPFCSRDCYLDYHTVDIECEVCGETKTVKKSHSGQRYCSEDCRLKSFEEAYTRFECARPNCSTTEYLTKNKARRKTYCSRSCTAKARHESNDSEDAETNASSSDHASAD